MPKIKLKLSTDSINQALKEVKAYQKKVDRAGAEIVKVATEMGVEEAKNQALYMNAYDSGDLVNGIVAEYRDGKGYIHSTAMHTMFVEMGTGVTGKNSPGSTIPGWEYDINEHGEEGWYYYDKDGKRHWTKGMPSRPFMYETAKTLRQSIPWIVEGVLKDD